MAEDRTLNIYHPDGRITYWSVYRQQWMQHANSIPDQELAAMNEDERLRVAAHFARNLDEADEPSYYDDYDEAEAQIEAEAGGA